MDGGEVLVLDTEEVQVMGGGVTLLLGEGLQGATASLLLEEVVATAGHLTTVMVVGIHLMVTAVVNTAGHQQVTGPIVIHLMLMGTDLEEDVIFGAFALG